MLVLWDRISSAHTATSFMSHAQLSITPPPSHPSNQSIFKQTFYINARRTELSLHQWGVYEPALSETSIYWSSLISSEVIILELREALERFTLEWAGMSTLINPPSVPKKTLGLHHTPPRTAGRDRGVRWVTLQVRFVGFHNSGEFDQSEWLDLTLLLL